MGKRSTIWLLAAFAAVTLGLLTFVSCGGDGPNVPSPVGDLSPGPIAGAPAPATPTRTAEGTAGVCAGKQVHMTPNGALGYCVLDTNLLPNQCGQYIDPGMTDRVYLKIGIVAPGGGYTRTAIYHDPKTGKTKYDCGAVQSNAGADPENNGKSFKDGDIVEFWRPIPRDACGRDQWDGDLRDGTNRIDVLGFVFNYPKDCTSCALVDPQLKCSGGLVGNTTRTLETYPAQCKGSWTGGGVGTLNWGDESSSQKVANPFLESHGYVRSESDVTRTITLNVEVDGLLCPTTTTIEIPKRQTSCDDLKLSFGEVSCDAQPAVLPSVRRCFSGSFSAGTASVDFGDSSPAQSIPDSPFTTSHNYVQTSTLQNFTATMNVAYEGLTCPKSVNVEIPPLVDPCADVGNPAFILEKIDGNTTSTVESKLTYNAGFAGFITISPAPVSGYSGGAATSGVNYSSLFNRPTYGQPSLNVDYTWEVKKGGQVCKSGKAATSIPPQEKRRCGLTLVKDVDKSQARDGDYLKYSLTVSNDGDADCTGGGVLVTDGVPTNVDYVASSGTVGQCHWVSPIKWNCGTMKPGASITVWWKGKVDNPQGNCDDFVIRNKASAWSDQTQTIWSNEVQTSVDIMCESTCPPGQTTTSVTWTKLPASTYGVNPRCADFGLASLYKKEFGGSVQNWATDRDASIVIVKDGNCDADGPQFYAKKVSPQDSKKWIKAGLAVSFSCGGKTKDLSHVEMCGCPVGPAASGAFDPYVVPDPTFE